LTRQKIIASPQVLLQRKAIERLRAVPAATVDGFVWTCVCKP